MNVPIINSSHSVVAGENYVVVQNAVDQEQISPVSMDATTTTTTRASDVPNCNNSSYNDIVATNSKTPSFVPIATTLVRDIYEQITANDAPAGNEIVATTVSPYNLDCIKDVEEGIPNTTSLDTDITEPYTAPIVDHSNQISQQQQAVIKMGNLELASLCTYTLENLVINCSSGSIVAPTASSHQSVSMDWKTATSTVDTKSPSSNKKSTNNKPSPTKKIKKFSLIWNKGTYNHNSNNNTGGFPRHHFEEEKKVEEQISHVRLQLFGSEYARHLSSCQLAPSVVFANKPSKILQQRRKQYSARTRCVLLEDAKMPIQTGALLDIVVTCNDEPPPSSYYRVSQTDTGRSATFGGLSDVMYLNVKKEAVWDKAAQRPCVTAITLIFPDRQEFVPPGFCIVRLASNGQPANLNQSIQGSERVYLCIRRSREGNPITGLLPLVPAHGEVIPAGYTVIEHTPRHLSATITTATGESMFLAYRQRLANLELLRPPQLVATILQCNQNSSYKHQSRPTLAAYYCTGATIVESDIGRFHIMDRSTHSLLSPSSVANRMNLIEMSRRKCYDDTASTPKLTYARSDCGDSDAGSNSSYSSIGRQHRQESRVPTLKHASGGGSLADSPIHEKVIADDCTSEMSTTMKEENDDEDKAANLSSLLSSTVIHEQSSAESELQRSREAMSFIPQIETVNQEDGTTLQLRIQLLTPILTTCYTRHGGSALLAVEGLTMLLTTTDFFKCDVNQDAEFNSGSDTRITLLDLAMQAVSDVATSGAQEATFASCLEFIEHAVSFAQGQLNTRTIGYVFRFYLFVFYFDASMPCRQSEKWPALAWRPLAMYNEEDFPMLYDPRHDGPKCGGYLPGGAPQVASLALKELISFSIERFGKISIAGALLVQSNSFDGQNTHVDTSKDKDNLYPPFVSDLLSSLVDKSVDLVERANYTQLALHQIHRSGGSELFWHDMIYECGSGLFSKNNNLSEVGKEMLTLLFAMLQQLVKVSAGKLRPPTDDVELQPKDIASKLLSLELLLHFLEFWSDEREALRNMVHYDEAGALETTNTLMFAVRRTVVPCLLWNTKASLQNPQVFRRVIRIVSELWCSPVYRKHCKVELGLLMEHFALKILELGPQCVYSNSSRKDFDSLLPQQIELIGEIKNWLSSDPKDVIEMYLNYDTNITEEVTGQFNFLPGTRWQVFQRLCAGLSGIAEKCGEMIGNQILQNQSIILSSDKFNGTSSRNEAKRDATEKAELREAARVLRKVSLDAIAQIVKSLAISAGAGSGSDMLNLMLTWCPQSETPISYQGMLRDSLSTTALRDKDERHVKQYQLHLSSSYGDDGVIKFWRKVIGKEETKRFAGSFPNHADSLDTAFGIMQQKNLKKAIEYLIACNLLTPAPRDIANFLRIHKERINPVSLGQYLGENGNGGSEAEYWNSIRYLFVRGISFIGVNIEKGLRQFLTESGFRLPGEAQQIDRLVNTFAQCYFEDNAGDNQWCPFKDQDTIYLIVFAIIMLNTDLHKTDATSRKSQKKMSKTEFINNLRGASVNEGVAKDYLSSVYDSIEANPIAMLTTSDTASISKVKQTESLDEILKNVGLSDSLLRGLAVHDFKFATIDDFVDCLDYSDQHALADLTRSCVSKTWHQWYGALNTCMENAHLDPQGMEPAIDILLYALAVTVCLNMPMERAAFLSQLVRLRSFEERRQGRWVSPLDNSHREEQWYVELEEASSGSKDQKIWALTKIHEWVHSLKAALRVDVHFKVEMTEAVAELLDADFLLQDPARAFLQSGNLFKKSGRTGRTTLYRFYLFSDVLLYASKVGDGRYKIHEELPVHLMKIVDWFPPSQKNRKVMFEIHHPRKSFQVICLSEESRKSWVENIRASILVEMKRKMVMEAARLSVRTGKEK